MKNSEVNYICTGNGYFNSQKNVVSPAKAMDVYRLCYFSEGHATISVDGTQFRVNKGQTALLYPFSDITVASSDKVWKYKWIDFKGIEAEYLVNMTAFEKLNPIADAVASIDLESLFDIGEVGYEEYLKCRCNGRFMVLLSYYVEYFPKTTKKNYSYVLMAREYIENNYSNPECNVKKVADFIKIERTYLYRLFKAQVGMSVIEYINRCRILKAEKLLSDKNISIKNIAYSVGYSDQMYFSRVFKKMYGITPTQYRKICTERYTGL